ncbi:MAG: sugar ABC transporter substrate-binding protein [Bacteroidota bacterium]
MKKFFSILKKFFFPALMIFVFSCSQKNEHDRIRFVSLAWQEQSLAANKEIIQEWNRLHPGKEVEYVQANWTSIYDYLITSFETGDVPDVFHYEASMITDFGLRGNLTDLRQYISDSLKNDIYPSAWESVTLNDGRIIGVPFFFESLIVLYNKDIFEKNNIELPTHEKPWTWNELKNTAIKLTKDFDHDGKTDQWGAAIGLKISGNIILNLTLGFSGGFFYKVGNEYKVRIEEPEKKLLTTIHDMIYEDKSMSPFAASQSGSGLVPQFYNGKYAMLIGIGTWARQQIVENAPKNFRWGVLEPIKEINQEQGSNTQTLSIPSGSKRKKDAAEFIEFFLGKKNLARLALSDWMNPTRISCRTMPEFQNEKLGWKTTISMIDNLRMGPWLQVPGFSEWKGRVANPIFQEYFSGRMSFEEMRNSLIEESDYVLSRYKIRD